jgi:hypothetical protein
MVEKSERPKVQQTDEQMAPQSVNEFWGPQLVFESVEMLDFWTAAQSESLLEKQLDPQ